MSRLRAFFALPWADRLLYCEAACCLSIARLAIWCLSFKRIAGYLGSTEEPQNEPEIESPPVVQKIALAINTMSRHLPWQCLCLVQAIAARLMLGRRGFPVTIYFGVTKDPEEGLRAHAWLRQGEYVVTGKKGMEQFQVIMTYTSQGSTH